MKNADGSNSWKKCANEKQKTGPGRKKSADSKRRSGPEERLKKRLWSSSAAGLLTGLSSLAWPPTAQCWVSRG